MNSQRPRCPFALLGVPHGTLIADARKAYVEKLKTAHPDRGGSLELAQELGEAFELIKSMDWRERCDCASRSTPPASGASSRFSGFQTGFEFFDGADMEELLRRAAEALRRAEAQRAYSQRPRRDPPPPRPEPRYAPRGTRFNGYGGRFYQDREPPSPRFVTPSPETAELFRGAVASHAKARAEAKARQEEEDEEIPF